jgi:O-antigen/teichoic acid export membrane protein
MTTSSTLKSLPRFRHGLLANFAGTGWSALMQLVCIPLYIKFLGIESYGLIGFYLMFQTMMQILDLGLSPTMSREMARFSVQPEKAAEARDLVRTLEAGYWVIGIVAGTALVCASPWVATHWIKAASIPTRRVSEAVMLMGVLAVFQWPATFYQGGLMGLGRQVLYNTLVICFSTLSNVGAILILWRVSPTIRAFFLWFVATNALRAVFLIIFLWKSLPPATRLSHFNFDCLRSIGRFAAGMSGITVCSLILTQSDKVILSKLLDLKLFGYYCVAGTLGAGLSMIVGSVFNAIFPRFAALAQAGDEETLKQFYHRSTQLMALLILPPAAVLAFFSTDILYLWTKSADVARNAGPIATLLVIGFALNGLMNLPYALQLAFGWVSIALRLAITITAIAVPAIWFLATSYGGVGAAAVWVGINALYIAIGVPLTHRRLLRHEMTKWFLQDIVPLLTAATLVAGLARVLITSPMSPLMTLAVLLVVLLAALTATASLSSHTRRYLLAELSRIRLGYT